MNETPETRAKLAGAIRQLQASGDTANIERLVSAYKAKYQTPQPTTFNQSPVERQNIRTDIQSDIATSAQEAQQANSLIGVGKGNFFGVSVPKLYGKIPEFGKALVENIAPSEVGLGKTLSGIFNSGQTQQTAKLVQDTADSQVALAKLIRKQKAEGKDTTKLEGIFNEGQRQAQELTGSIPQLPKTSTVVGQLGGTALDLLTAGQFGRSTVGMKSGALATKTSLPKALSTAVSPELAQVAQTKAKGLFSKAGGLNVLKNTGIGYASDVTSGLAGLRGEDRTGNKAFIPGAGTAITGGVSTIGELTQTVQNVKSGKAKENAINELENKYTEWSSGTKPGKKLVNSVNSKTEMFNKSGTTGKTPMRVLAENGVVPEVKGTKFNTFDQADSFRSSTQPLKETSRQALLEANLSTEATPLDILEQRAISLAKTKENINSGRYDKMAEEIKKEFALLKKNYPDGKINLDVQDEIKSARWDNVFKNKGLVDADVLKKDSEYVIAKAFQKNIEDVAEKAGHFDVAQLNREIGDKLEAAKFLESLDGKNLKGGRLGKFVGTLIGSSFSNSIPGKIIGAVGGNYVADLLIKSDVQSPVRRAILRNLQAKDPEAYLLTVKWLQEQDLARKTRLALPSPKNLSIVNEGRPIKVFPSSVEGNYTGKDLAVQSKSPTAQQTSTAINSDISIPKSVPEETYVSQGIREGKDILNSLKDKQIGMSIKATKLPPGDKNTLIRLIDDIRLNKKTIFSDAEESLLMDYGIDPNKAPNTIANQLDDMVSRASKTKLPSANSLIQEAKKNRPEIADILDGKKPVFHSGSIPEGANFDMRKSKGGEYGKGVYFSVSEEGSKLYGGTPNQYYLDVKKPYVVTNNEWLSPNVEKNARAGGYDSIIDINKGRNTQIIALNKNIIKPVNNTTDVLLQEAKKYKSAEEFVNKADVTKTTEFKKWAGNNKVIEVYHGSPNEFDSFKVGNDVYNVSGQPTSGISFADDFKNAEPFSRQYSERYNTEYKQIYDKFEKLYNEAKATGENGDFSTILKKLGANSNKISSEDASVLLRYRGKRELEKILTKDELNKLEELAFGNKEKLNALSKQKEQEISKLDKKYANEGKVYKAYLKGKIIEVNGEDIGFGASRNELVDNLAPNEILKINNADTGQYVGTEYMTNNPDNIFVVNAGKTKSQLTNIWNKANKNVKINTKK